MTTAPPLLVARYLLDTNTVIALMKGADDVARRVRQLDPAELTLCAPVEAELWFGVARSDPARQAHNRKALLTLLDWLPSLPFAGEATVLFGEIRAYLARQGKPIGPYDLQIAAIARFHELTVVTRNVREFERVPGLSVENWQPV
jgi:tRNA(fMet)-specific endonuclease VapC